MHFSGSLSQDEEGQACEPGFAPTPSGAGLTFNPTPQGALEPPLEETSHSLQTTLRPFSLCCPLWFSLLPFLSLHPTRQKQDPSTTWLRREAPRTAWRRKDKLRNTSSWSQGPTGDLRLDGQESSCFKNWGPACLGRRESLGKPPFSQDCHKTTAERRKKTPPLAFFRARPPSAGLSARHAPRSASGSWRGSLRS